MLLVVPCDSMMHNHAALQQLHEYRAGVASELTRHRHQPDPVLRLPMLWTIVSKERAQIRSNGRLDHGVAVLIVIR
jgi:hypothetical protein